MELEDFTKIYGLKRDSFVLYYQNNYYDYFQYENEEYWKWQIVQIYENQIPYCKTEIWTELKEVNDNLNNGFVYSLTKREFHFKSGDKCYVKYYSNEIWEGEFDLDDLYELMENGKIVKEYPEEIDKYISLPPK